MFDPLSIRRLARSTSPDAELRTRARGRLMRQIEPKPLIDAVRLVQPSTQFRHTLKHRVFKSIRSESAELLPELAHGLDMSARRKAQLKTHILSRLSARRMPWAPTFLKWTAAFAVFMLVVQSLPLIFLAPVLQAEAGVQIVANGDVQVTIAGIPTTLTSTMYLRGPATIRTGNSQARIIFNDDGVVRIDSNSEVRVNDIGDRPHFASQRPTIMLNKGQLWALGMLPPSFLPLSVGTSQGILAVNAGSASVRDDGKRVTVSVFDRGASFQTATQQVFLVTGERVSAGGKTLVSSDIPSAQFSQPWVSANLDMDGVHRAETAQLEQKRRQKIAGILPTSPLYFGKRFIEEVDVIMTLDKESRVAKRIAQADTRLNEAMTLLSEGQSAEAEKPLTEYKETLTAVATATGDSVTRFLIQQQIDDVSSSIAVAGEDELQPLQQTVLDVTKAIPETNAAMPLQEQVLVGKLISINQSLALSADPHAALQAYNAMKPELDAMLAESEEHSPLVQKELSSLLSSIAIKFDDATQGSTDPEIIALQAEFEPYLPSQPQAVVVTDEEINADVQRAYDQIYNLRMAISRYNELQRVMGDWEQDPNRGTKLRRLKSILPDGLAGYVQTEIEEAGHQLNEASDFRL